MYVTVDTIIKMAAVLAACGTLIAFVIKVYKKLDNNEKQNEVIKSIQEEQKIICYGLKGALQGLVESGCNGPCKDALAMLDKHLNKAAHEKDLE